MKEEIQTSENRMQVFGSTQNFESAMRMAKCLAASAIVPAIYQGENGLPNCIIALEMANRIGASPMMIMQNLYIVKGNPGWSSKFLIATLNTCGKFSPIRYEFMGKEGTDGWSCRAYATDKTGETLKGSWVSINMAKKEGWFSKPGSKWQTMPELMLQYRAAAFFQRAYAPEISMGMKTADEIEDIDNVDDQTTEQRVESEIKSEANKQTISFDSVSVKQPKAKVPNEVKADTADDNKSEMPDIFK